ncbi:MAG: hypothetical protein JWN03_3617 [Nocardia sp.]|uniref:DUF6636 domain-containing protein n=1 Tax=Nocardia sp. TaxID=1821 RepID=UPI002633D13A|nr:DUF6636 domain-containing protein [Nocardia sp.]MCU1643342.1 hypothetical protein [Nocardia sp.]
MRAWVLAFAVVAAVGGIAGCNDNKVTSGGTPTSGATISAAAADGGAQTTVAGPVTTAPTRNDANVDARDFQQGDKYYFQSPTGNIMCGIIDDKNFGTGCQLEHASVVPSQLSDCGTRPERAVAAEVMGGAAKFLCLNQGVFVGSPTDGTNKGGGKVLRYGQTLIVRGTACTSTQAGIRCDAGGHGFLIAADQQQLF